MNEFKTQYGKFNKKKTDNHYDQQIEQLKKEIRTKD